MNEREKRAEAVRRMVRKYAATMTDEQMAVRYGLSVYCVEKARQRLGIVKVGRRPKRPDNVV